MKSIDNSIIRLIFASVIETVNKLSIKKKVKMKLHNDIKVLKSQITTKVNKATTPRQLHFDNVAREMGYADSNIAFKVLGKAFIEKAKINAPSISL